MYFTSGKDSGGFHISTQDVMELDADGTMIISGPQGITGTPRDATFLIGIILVLITLFIVINLTNSRSGRGNHVYPRQPDCGRVNRNQCNEITN